MHDGCTNRTELIHLFSRKIDEGYEVSLVGYNLSSIAESSHAVCTAVQGPDLRRNQ